VIVNLSSNTKVWRGKNVEGWLAKGGGKKKETFTQDGGVSHWINVEEVSQRRFQNHTKREGNEGEGVTQVRKAKGRNLIF